MRKNKVFKVFIACDTTNIKKIKEIIKYSKTDRLRIGYKFGLEFLNSKNGRKFIASIKNKILFGDYKISDIPNTLQATKKVAGKVKLIGVTTLTSLDNKSLKEIGYNGNINKVVLKQAILARKANLDAIVCSPKEVKLVKKVFRKEIITPGIRFNSKLDDQKRVLTPKQAYKNGSDWLVIGRPVTKGNIKKNIKKLIDHLSQ